MSICFYFCRFRLFIRCGQFFLGDIALPVCHDEGGERKGYYESDEAEERAPYGEREQEYGWVESHLLAHYLWCHDHINDDLHNGEDEKGEAEDYPETLSGIERLKSCEESGRDEGEGVEIWHEVEDTDKDAETDSHWEVYDGEADAEEYAHGEGYEALSAHVCVEGVAGILCQFLPEVMGGLWEDAYPVLGEILVVEQDEEHIEEYDT